MIDYVGQLRLLISHHFLNVLISDLTYVFSLNMLVQMFVNVCV